MDDAELVRQARAGQAEAYAELVRRWAGRVVAVCHAATGRADAADDLAQEALLRGYRALATLAEPAKFGAWLCGIARRACLDWLKSPQRGQVPFSAMGSGWHPEDLLGDPSANGSIAERYDERRCLLAEVEALPEDYRTAVMLYYYQDVTYRDLADQLGVSPATVNARLTKARALLRERLTRRLSPKAGGRS